MNVDRVDLVLRFALAAAGQEDPGQQELGPIHLLKYVYLADLAYAERHDGETYTGTPWTFYRFGPWAVDVLGRIESVTESVHAQRRVFAGRDAEERVRFKVLDDHLFAETARDLPPEIVSAVRRAVHEYGDDTGGLLSYVYRTDPMLRAVPGELLHFAAAPAAETAAPPAEPEAPTAKVRRARKEAVRQARVEMQERLAARRRERAAVVVVQPRYDEVFEEGVRWLDSLAGEPVPTLEGGATFSDDIWTSPTRAGRDVP